MYYQLMTLYTRISTITMQEVTMTLRLGLADLRYLIDVDIDMVGDNSTCTIR